MGSYRTLPVFACIVCLSLLLAISAVRAEERVLLPYAGYNEMNGPIWIAIEKGFFKKYGLDVGMVQVRTGALSIASLASGSVRAIWVYPSYVLGAASGGMKIGCVASSSNTIPRELVVRKGIKSFEDLRGKVFGVQNIGGGTWLQTMVVLESLGLDPDRYQLIMRIIGDTTVVTQALISESIDAAVLPYSFSNQAKRAGLRSLADSGKLKAPYQGNAICTQRDVIGNSPDLIMSLVKGLIEGVVFALDPAYKQDMMEFLKKKLQLTKAEDVEASYKVLRLMTTIDVAPSLEAWRNIQRLTSRVNPKVAQVDLDQVMIGSFVQELERTGFLPEMRKKLRR